MKTFLGFLLRWALATAIVGLTSQAFLHAKPSLQWLWFLVLGNLLVLGVMAFPLAFLRWSWLLMSGGVMAAAVLGAPLLGVPAWVAAIGAALMSLVAIVAWRQHERRAPAVRVRDQQGRHVELSVIRREGGHLLQLVSAESRAALATAAPSVLPVGALKLNETPVIDDKLVVYPGYINTQTGYFSQGGSYTTKVDTGRRFIRIADEGGVVLPPDHLLDAEARRRAPAARAGQRPTSIGFVVSKGQAARIDGVAEYRVDEQGRVTHFLELNRSGEAFLRVPGEDRRYPAPTGADLVLALLEPRTAPAGTPAWDGGVALGGGSELVKMARYVQQMR